MKRTTLAVVLATGALAVPAVAYAAGGDDPATQTQQQAPQTAPVQQEQPQQPDQQRPDGRDCPEHDGSGGSGESSGGSGSGDTLL